MSTFGHTEVMNIEMSKGFICDDSSSLTFSISDGAFCDELKNKKPNIISITEGKKEDKPTKKNQNFDLCNNKKHVKSARLNDCNPVESHKNNEHSFGDDCIINEKGFAYSSFEEDIDDVGDDDWTVNEMVMSSSILSEIDAPSFMLLSHTEELMVKDASSFVELLNSEADAKMKVVSIIGNTGEGKSHTMNETFCDGKPVFQTSSRQKATTVGCWAAYDSLHQAILLDTEGMLNNNTQPIRLLLKVMAISDVVIYRTRSERLHSDMFQFLGDACSLLHTHFSFIPLLPSIVISHCTQHTELLAKGCKEAARTLLHKRFQDMSLEYQHYPGIHYIASKAHSSSGNHHSNGGYDSSFSELLLQVKQLLSNKQLPAPRTARTIFKALKKLNDKFSGPLPRYPSSSSEFFTCSSVCSACQASCDQTMNHQSLPHHSTSQCIATKQHNNTRYLCKKCLSRGVRRVVQAPPSSIASYAWSGYSLECSHCGVVYRSRSSWFASGVCEEEAVVTVVEHVWPGGHQQGSSIDSNVAQRVVDGVVGVSERLSAPCKYVCGWLSHQIKPPYWEANHLIKTCRACAVVFSDAVSIHHCRACGRGFCESCSSKSRPVRERGWGDVAVRVCDQCYNQPSQSSLLPGQDEVMVRRVGEAVGSTIGAVSSIFSYPLAALKQAARPDYWVPDHQISHCALCNTPFKHSSHPNSKNNHQLKAATPSHIPLSSSDTKLSRSNLNEDFDNLDVSGATRHSSHTSLPLSLHHCRSCGQGVCGDCSEHRMEVPARGWHHPVRVCDHCWRASTSHKS